MLLAATLAGRFIDSRWPRVWTQCVPRTRGYYSSATVYSTAVQQFLFFRVLVHTLSEGAINGPTEGLIIVSPVRRRDMARLFDSGESSSASDSVRLVSMPTTRSSAVLR